MKRKTELSKKVLLSVLAAGVMSTCVMGNALAGTHNDLWTVNGETIENRVLTNQGYNAEDLRLGANISDSKFINNKFDNNKDIYGGLFRLMNTVNPEKTTVNISNTVFDGNIATTSASHNWALGGAIMIKGGTSTFTDVTFNNNRIISTGTDTQTGGGALYVDAVKNSDVTKPDGNANVKIVAKKNLSYKGNTVQTSDGGTVWYDTYGGLAQSKGGFLFIDRDAAVEFEVNDGATLTIGEKNSTDKNADTIASVMPKAGSTTDFAVIKKTGEGNLVVNSSLNDYYGEMYVNAGSLEVGSDWNLHNKLVLEANTKVSAENITLDSVTGKVTAYDSSNQNKVEYTFKDAIASITTASGSTLTAKNIVVYAGNIQADGTVNASSVFAKNGTTVALNGGGTISGSRDTGLENEDYADIAISAENGSKVTTQDFAITGEVKSNGKDTKITLNGGSVTAGKFVNEDGYTEIGAHHDGVVELNNVKINSNLGAFNGGTIYVNDSDVNAVHGIVAEGKGSVVNLEGSSDNVYTVGEFILALDGAKIYIDGGTLKEDNLKQKMYGYKDDEDVLNSDAQGIVLAGNGIIETKSDQIYSNTASATQKEAGNVTNEGIDFQGGTLSLNDAEYTLAYAKDAGSKVGYTKVVMTGKLADAINDTIKVDEAAVIGDNVALDKVTAEAEGNLLVGSESNSVSDTDVEGIKIKDQVKNGFAVGSLNLAADSKGVVITNDKEVTLGGSKGGSLITVDGKNADVKVVVGTDGSSSPVDGAISTKGNLNIGNTLATADTQYKLNGEVVVNQNSNLNVNGTTEITKSLTLNSGAVSVNAGSLTTDKLNVTNGTSNLFGSVNANKLEVGASATLAIGDEEDAGKLTVKEAKLNGGMLFLDPAFKDGATISDASGVAVTNASTLDGAYVAGQNSKLSFGADLQTAEDTFAKTAEIWGEKGVTAAAYVAKSVDVANGSVSVNGALTAAPTAPAVGTVEFAANSLLMVDGAETVSTAAITGVNSATVDDTSKLYIDNAKKGATYKILAGAGIASGWDEANIISSNSLLKFAKDTDDTKYNVTASVQSVKDAFNGEVIAPNAYDAALNATGANAASDFVMNAADSKVNATKAEQISALNSAAAMSELAGVEHGTYAASNLLTDAVADHMSLANAKDHDSDIWAKYIHTKENIDGLSIANFSADYDAQYNGIVVGADLYKNGKATVGAALTYVDGNINGNTLAARTKNDATYYGASIYGGIQNDDSAVIGDISYLHGKNDITQYNSGTNLTADAKSDALSIGVRAEKSVKAGVGKFVPYAGIRYMHLGTGNYTNSIGMSYDADDMNLWLLPVGVKYSADVKAGAWTIRPIAEVGYVWNMGDRDSTQTVSLNGAGDGFGYDVTDSGSYIGRFMIEAEKANVTYGLGYEYQKGDSVKANRWMANLNWSF